MSATGTIVGLAAVVVTGGGALSRALATPRALPRRRGMGDHHATLRGRLWVAFNPSTRVDLFERGLVLTPTFLPRLAIAREEIAAVDRVKDARRSGRRRGPGTRVRHGEGRSLALELDDAAHATLLRWWSAHAPTRSGR